MVNVSRKDVAMAVTMEQEIVEQEERLADAKRALDLGAIDRIYADDLLLTGVMGEPTCSKTAVIDEVKRGIAEREHARASGQPLVMSAVNEDMKVVRHGDTAITNYRFVVKIKTPTADVARRYRATNVWKQQDGRWQIIAAHMSFVLDPTQAAMLSGEGR
jgi:ketosteroid isomerase-like protein